MASKVKYGSGVIEYDGELLPGESYVIVDDGTGPKIEHRPRRERQDGDWQRVNLSPDAYAAVLAMRTEIRKMSGHTFSAERDVSASALILAGVKVSGVELSVYLEANRVHLRTAGLAEDVIDKVMVDIERGARENMGFSTEEKVTEEIVTEEIQSS